jgi:hypothetical protein
MRLELVKSADAARAAESKNEGRDKADAENREKLRVSEEQLRVSEERCAQMNSKLGDVAAEKDHLQMRIVDLEGKLRNLEIEVKNTEMQKRAEKEKREAEEEADRYKKLALKKEEDMSALRVEMRSEIDRVSAFNADLTRQLEIERHEVKTKREEIITTKEEVVSMKEQVMRSKEASMVALDRLQVICPCSFILYYCGRTMPNDCHDVWSYKVIISFSIAAKFSQSLEGTSFPETGVFFSLCATLAPQVEVSKSRIRASELEAALSEKESTRER